MFGMSASLPSYMLLWGFAVYTAVENIKLSEGHKTSES